MPIEVRSLAEWEAAGQPDLLSVLIPAHNEEGHIEETVRTLDTALNAASIRHEILVVNDNSRDRTRAILDGLTAEIPALRVVDNAKPNGFGFAVRRGFSEFSGSAIAIVMADGSDLPSDVVAFYRKLQDGYDCVFGSRFIAGGRVLDYPRPKLMLNRIGNQIIRLLFVSRYNDFTNAFKMYRRRVIGGVQPILSQHFNLTVELPLKAMVRGYTYAVVPNTWTNRREGISKFKIREMGSRYFFIILYCLLEKWLAQGDYSKREDLREGQLQVWPR